MRLTRTLVIFLWLACLVTLALAAYLDQYTLTLAGAVTSRVLLSVVFAIACWFFIARVLMAPLARMTLTTGRIRDGDLEARTGLTLANELGELAQSIDHIGLEQLRSSNLRTEREEQLEQQVSILAAQCGRLAEGDLRLSDQTARGLIQPLALALRHTSLQLGHSLSVLQGGAHRVVDLSNRVKTQTDEVVLIARRERDELEQARAELQSASETMAKVARLATACSQAADNAIGTTREARASVTDTLEKMARVRDVLRETERRVKRLGERSQEVASTAEDIGLVSERTQVLALNAGMQAAQGGVQAQGFGLVADEVQRLAQLVQAASQDISRVVAGIHGETAAALTVLSELIDEVVASSTSAERSGSDMASTEAATARLVRMVQHIASAAVLQTRLTRRVEERARTILDGIGRTGVRLMEQGEATEQLLEESLTVLGELEHYRLPASTVTAAGSA
jgi:methyl-accepting chemotaxis protein